jgi:hypothetical protein
MSFLDNILGSEGLLGLISGVGTNVASARQAQKQMAFQERMSNTSIQRRMTDLRAGGLNPILAGKHEASSPGGAMAQMKDPATSALAARRLGQEMKNLEAQYNATNAQGHAATSAAALATANAHARAGDIAKARVDAEYYNSAAGRLARFAELGFNSAKGLGAIIGGGAVLKRLKPTNPGFKPAQFNRKTGELR